jgi:hypothetical protein
MVARREASLQHGGDPDDRRGGREATEPRAEGGYVAVHLTRDRMETRFQAISERRDPTATVSTLRRFVVESGKAGGRTGVTAWQVERQRAATCQKIVRLLLNRG